MPADPDDLEQRGQRGPLLTFDQGEHQPLEIAECVVDDGARHARLASDGLDRDRVKPGLGEDVERGVEQLLAPELRCGAGGVLAGLTIYQAEFGFGVPQYNLLFQPTLLAFTGALALVFARAAAGRGAALGAVVMNLVISAGFTLFVGPVAGEALPHFATYLPAALCIEVAAFVIPARAVTAFGLLSGVLVGTLGTIGEWGWTHVWMPIPWPAHFVPSAIAIGVPAGICGGLVGAFVARALGGSRRFTLPVGRWWPGALGAVGFAALLAFCLPTHPPAGATATVTLTATAGTHQPLTAATAMVRFHPASTVSHPDYVQQLSWQGHAKSVVGIMRRESPGVYRTVKPLPVTGSWKSLIRIQQGRERADVPVYLPADPAIPAAEIPAARRITRALIADTALMQRERKRDVPGWLWSTATLVVLSIIAVLVAIIGWGLNRVAVLGAGGTPPLSRVRRAWSRPAPAGAGR